jgi:S-methylmethionine-dependent homocysteine/selenocysteine methylase
MVMPDERLGRGDVLILDGGTGTELQRRGVPMDGVAWSATAMLHHGDTLREIHADYIRAGAEIITTNTFAAARHMLEPAGLGDRVRELNRTAVALVREARDHAAGGREVWIAGSISTMAPGADHARRPDAAAAAPHYREQAEVLAEAGVDLLLLEMMRDVDHTRAAIAAAAATSLPVWVGFSCARSTRGEVVMFPGILEDAPFRAVIGPAMAAGGSLVAVMHSEVEDIGPALEVARGAWPGPLGAYAHRGRFVMPDWQFDDTITPEDYLAAARRWVELGARVVGGCCGIGPDHIRVLAEGLPRRLPLPLPPQGGRGQG